MVEFWQIKAGYILGTFSSIIITNYCFYLFFYLMAEEPSAYHLFKSLLLFNFTRFEISGLQHGLQTPYF
jgi:hypothetical protein